MRSLTVFSTLIFLLIGSMIFADEGQVNFSGEWAFNQDKSETGGGRGRGRMATAKLVVTQNADKIIIERSGKRRNGDEFSYKEELPLNGKETKLENSFGADVTASAKWTDGGKTLTITSTTVFNRNGREFEMHSTNVWSLLENGKVLSIASTRTTPRGERNSKLVYDKTK